MVSLDPASGATLERLGDNLNRAEREARATRDLRDAADGWLTLGYGGLPGVALEAPADGTVLSLDEILSALGRRRRPLR